MLGSDMAITVGKNEYICLHCNTSTFTDEDDFATVCDHCPNVAWRLRCNCTGYMSNGVCQECGAGNLKPSE